MQLKNYFSKDKFSKKGQKMIEFFYNYQNANTKEEKNMVLDICRRKENGKIVSEIIYHSKNESDFLFNMALFPQYMDWDIVLLTISDILNSISSNNYQIDCINNIEISPYEKKYMSSVVTGCESQCKTALRLILKDNNGTKVTAFCKIQEGSYISEMNYLYDLKLVLHQTIEVTDEEAGLEFGLNDYFNNLYPYPKKQIVRGGFYENYVLAKMAKSFEPDIIYNNGNHKYTPNEIEERTYQMKINNPTLTEEGVIFDIFYDITLDKTFEQSILHSLIKARLVNAKEFL